MAEPKPPHAGERLTRADVLRLIAEHGGPEGLDLRRRNLRQADLQRANLHEAHLEGANLVEAKLQGAALEGARLKQAHVGWADLRAAVLADANLQGADLSAANLYQARLTSANLQDAHLAANFEATDLRGADLRRARLAYASLRDANLEGANWGDYVLGDEIGGNFDAAASVYRALKQWHNEAGMYDIAGEFFYHEMEARRKLAWRGDPDSKQARRRPYAAALYLLRFLYGYGERPLRVIRSAAAVILGLAFVYSLPGVLTGGFRDALYYSAVSFTALGYGWAAAPQGWAGRFLGVGESLMGVFMMALFLVTFTRKMTR